MAWGRTQNRFLYEGLFCPVSTNFLISQLIYKYGYEKDIFTFNNDNIVNALVENPEMSLAYKIKYGLTH